MLWGWDVWAFMFAHSSLKYSSRFLVCVCVCACACVRACVRVYDGGIVFNRRTTFNIIVGEVHFLVSWTCVLWCRTNEHTHVPTHARAESFPKLTRDYIISYGG